MQRGQSFPENAVAKAAVCILQMRLRLLLELLQRDFFPHFADAVVFAGAAGDGLRILGGKIGRLNDSTNPLCLIYIAERACRLHSHHVRFATLVALTGPNSTQPNGSTNKRKMCRSHPNDPNRTWPSKLKPGNIFFEFQSKIVE
jgi:hypothetical protein